MSFSLVFSAAADEDIIESINWYNEQREGLGFEFYDQVQEKLDLLIQNPLHYPVRFKKVHALLVGRFPYLIYYKILEVQSTIEVVGILHTSRKPSEIKKRK